MTFFQFLLFTKCFLDPDKVLISDDDFGTRIMSKRDWHYDESCHARVYFENVNIPGCKSRPARNRLCYGMCNSIYTPDRFADCKACLPEKIIRRNISLDCLVDGVWKRVFPL